MKVRSIVSASCAVAMLAVPAMAHHSFAMFDREKTLTLSGVVKQFEWTNPHAWLYVMVMDDGGKAIEYPLEMQGTGQAQKNGWRPELGQTGRSRNGRNASAEVGLSWGTASDCGAGGRTEVGGHRRTAGSHNRRITVFVRPAPGARYSGRSSAFRVIPLR